ncbi:zinc protease [Pedobacter steynii]|uniref:Zinc protease n=2 Tax=Pedobacter steynii TaxID=430522 RepID=A0A1G9RFG4_9SPHI|nr:zinc protease [Pedobacter steynii]
MALSTSLGIFNTLGQVIPRDTAVRIGKLSNGLTYYIRHNTIPKNQADFYIAQKVGSVLEEENQRGLAHFLEHMAFNGTKHFPGNMLITELEKKGIKFGANINAYTGYDETVYKLTNIPLNRPGILDTALIILHDWSGFILNNDKDIDEERGVIREEWRTRSSSYLRVQENQILPKLFEGTPYANRLPIGLMEVVNNFKPQELKNYYKKWYRPDLQGIVVVGDFDVDEVEAKLKHVFSDIPKPSNPTSRKYFTIPDNKQPIIAITSDPEIRNTSAVVYWKLDTVEASKKESQQYFKIMLINRIVSNMLNERFAEMARENKATNSLSAIMGNYSVSSRPAWNLNIDAPNNDLKTALRTGLQECERMRRFGFSKNEFEYSIKDFNLTHNESQYYDRKNRNTFEYSREYVGQFLNGDISPTPEWRYLMTRSILNELSVDTLNFYAKKYIQDRNMAFEILYPVKEGLLLPSKSDIIKIWEEVKQTRLKPWIKDEKSNDLTTLKIPARGKVIKTEKNIAPFGFTKWSLSNGIEVWFKKTGYDEPSVYIYGFKAGGYSTVVMDDLPSAMAYTNIASLSTFEGINGRAQVQSKLDKNFESITGNGTILHPKILFQNIYLKMTKFKNEQEAFGNWKHKQQERNQSRSVNPQTVYADTLVSIMSNHHPRALSLNNPKVLDKVDYERINRLHEEHFGNANGFTFIMSGNLNEDSVKVLAEIWLGGLPSTNKLGKILDHRIYPPQGIVKRHFNKKMETPQSSITIGYTGEIPYTAENSVLMSISSEILKMIFTETIREQEGGSYGVGVSGELMKHPTERFLFQVNFDTDPNPIKKKKLIDIVYRELKMIMDKGPDQEKVEKVKQNLLKDYRESISKKDAKYWNGYQGAILFYGVDWITGYDKIISSITPEMIRSFTKDIFNQGNLIEVVMDPETK